LSLAVLGWPKKVVDEFVDVGWIQSCSSEHENPHPMLQRKALLH
jgi:hypothetical protein